jgi:hypothetical protein
VDVTPAGSLALSHGHDDPTALDYSCSLDMAEAGGLTLEQIAITLGVTRERVRQIERTALDRALRRAHEMGLSLDALAPPPPQGWPEP